MSEQAVSIAKCFWNSTDKFFTNPSSPMANENEINEAVVDEQRRNETNVKYRNKIRRICRIVECLISENITNW